MDADQQKELDALKAKFGPRLKEQFNIYDQINTEIEANPALTQDPTLITRRDDFLKAMETLSDEFEAAGGTEEQWGALAPAIHHGDFSP